MPNRFSRSTARRSAGGWLFLILLLLAWPPAGLAEEAARNPRWAQPVSLPQAENFFRLTDGLYRAAQPSAAAFKEYEKLGIRTVINLRANHSDRKLLAGTTLRLIEVPLNAWSIGDEDVITVLRLLKNEPGPILVHCQHGADRTGLMMAMYRLVFQGWSRPEARAEMVDGGFGFHRLWHNLPDYLRDVDLDKIKAACQ